MCLRVLRSLGRRWRDINTDVDVAGAQEVRTKNAGKDNYIALDLLHGWSPSNLVTKNSALAFGKKIGAPTVSGELSITVASIMIINHFLVLSICL